MKLAETNGFPVAEERRELKELRAELAALKQTGPHGGSKL